MLKKNLADPSFSGKSSNAAWESEWKRNGQRRKLPSGPNSPGREIRQVLIIIIFIGKLLSFLDSSRRLIGWLKNLSLRWRKLETIRRSQRRQGLADSRPNMRLRLVITPSLFYQTMLNLCKQLESESEMGPLQLSIKTTSHQRSWPKRLKTRSTREQR